jgi:hypothetical protein
MIGPAPRSGEALVSALAGGDETALAALLDRHVRAVHDFALRATLDESLAASVSEATFRRVAQQARAKPFDVGFRPWLYCLVLLEVQATWREGQDPHIALTDDRLFRSTADLEADILLWAWHAGRSLRTGDYCLLDLVLRRGLAPGDLMEAARATGSELYANLGHIRFAFDKNFTTNALYGRGGAACARLSDLLGDSLWGDNDREELREAIAEHAQGCHVCRSTIASLPAAEHVFVSIQDVEAPPGLAPRVFARVREYVVPPVPEPEPEPEPEPQPAPAPAIVAAAALPVAEAVEPEAASEPSTEPLTPDAQPERLVPEPAPQRLPGGRLQPAPGRSVGAWAAALRKAPIVWSYMLLGMATVVAIYVGIAVADSLQSGGQASGAVPLDAAVTANLGRAIDCSSPIQLTPGRSSAVTFDAGALAGFELADVAVRSDSPTAAGGLTATLEGPFTIHFQAAAVEAGSRQVDEYGLTITWRRGEEMALSNCRVEVSAAGAAR